MGFDGGMSELNAIHSEHGSLLQGRLLIKGEWTKKCFLVENIRRLPHKTIGDVFVVRKNSMIHTNCANVVGITIFSGNEGIFTHPSISCRWDQFMTDTRSDSLYYSGSRCPVTFHQLFHKLL